MALGNIIGSNIFNITVIVGAAGLASPVSQLIVPAELGRLDIPFLIGSSLLLLPVFISGSIVGRWEGAMFLCAYVFYINYNLLLAIQSSALRPFKN